MSILRRNCLPVMWLLFLFSPIAQSEISVKQPGNCAPEAAAIRVDASQEVQEKVREVAAEQLNVSPNTLDFSASFRSFGADSMKIYEIVAASAQHFGVAEFVLHEEFASLKGLSEAIEKARPLAVGLKHRGAQDAEATERLVFYVTNRSKSPEAEHSGDYFDGARAPEKKLHYGRAVVTIPKSHSFGKIEGPFMGLRMLENPSKHILLQNIEPLGAKKYFRELKALLATQGSSAAANQAFVFVHGFNVPFDEGVKRSAQIAHDISFAGAPILFSWPSDAKVSAYASDQEDAFWSIVYLKNFLSQVQKELAGTDIHLIAHSMGNQVLLGALRELKRSGHDREYVFQTITLAAPDFDADLFVEQYAEDLQPLAKLWTLYSSDNDFAMDISVKLNSNKRLGQPVTPIVGYQVIDASAIEVTPWSVPEFHSYYATKQRVAEDIKAVFRGQDAAERGLKRMRKDGLTYFEFN